jgi:hypothetical protein
MGRDLDIQYRKLFEFSVRYPLERRQASIGAGVTIGLVQRIGMELFVGTFFLYTAINAFFQCRRTVFVGPEHVFEFLVAITLTMVLCSLFTFVGTSEREGGDGEDDTDPQRPFHGTSLHFLLAPTSGVRGLELAIRVSPTLHLQVHHKRAHP